MSYSNNGKIKTQKVFISQSKQLRISLNKNKNNQTTAPNGRLLGIK